MAKKNVQDILDKLDSRDTDWRRDLLALYDIGGSDREVMRELDLTPYTWEKLISAGMDCEFAELVELGRMMAHAWWETQGRINLGNRSFNTGLWTINMKNRFGWSEKSESSLTNIDFRNMDVDEINREIQDLLARREAGRGQTVTS